MEARWVSWSALLTVPSLECQNAATQSHRTGSQWDVRKFGCAVRSMTRHSTAELTIQRHRQPPTKRTASEGETPPTTLCVGYSDGVGVGSLVGFSVLNHTSFAYRAARLQCPRYRLAVTSCHWLQWHWLQWHWLQWHWLQCHAV